jgi:hypothetical protein
MVKKRTEKCFVSALSDKELNKEGTYKKFLLVRQEPESNRCFAEKVVPFVALKNRFMRRIA